MHGLIRYRIRHPGQAPLVPVVLDFLAVLAFVVLNSTLGNYPTHLFVHCTTLSDKRINGYTR